MKVSIIYTGGARATVALSAALRPESGEDARAMLGRLAALLVEREVITLAEAIRAGHAERWDIQPVDAVPPASPALPPLPEPRTWLPATLPNGVHTRTYGVFTASQMHDYAHAALAQRRE